MGYSWLPTTRIFVVSSMTTALTLPVPRSMPSNRVMRDVSCVLDSQRQIEVNEPIQIYGSAQSDNCAKATSTPGFSAVRIELSRIRGSADSGNLDVLHACPFQRQLVCRPQIQVGFSLSRRADQVSGLAKGIFDRFDHLRPDLIIIRPDAWADSSLHVGGIGLIGIAHRPQHLYHNL